MKIKSNIAISESGFVFNPSTGESFSVNPIGIELIHMIRSNKSFSEISREILLNYKTDEITFEKDYHDFIKQLEYNNVIEKEGNEA